MGAGRPSQRPWPFSKRPSMAEPRRITVLSRATHKNMRFMLRQAPTTSPNKTCTFCSKNFFCLGILGSICKKSLIKAQRGCKTAPLGSAFWLQDIRWGARLFFIFLVNLTIGHRSLDFICRHVRFYLDHKCEINSKGLDPSYVTSRVLASKEDPRGGSSPWILSHSNFRSGPLILCLEGWVFEFYFCPT